MQLNDIVPNFKATALVDNVEKQIELKDFKGKKIILYFYPRDLTPGCTTQAENLRDNFQTLTQNNFQVIGISTDPIKKHISFVDKKQLPFILISDEDKKIHDLFGVWQLKKFMGREYMGTVRTTFILDENLKLIHIINKPKVKEHAKQILELFNK